jgi:hypothetical protein
VSAEIWLYKVPVPAKKITPETADLHPLISRVNCGGRNLTLVKSPAAEILPFIINKIVTLKRPYLHYRPRAA